MYNEEMKRKGIISECEYWRKAAESAKRKCEEHDEGSRSEKWKEHERAGASQIGDL